MRGHLPSLHSMRLMIGCQAFSAEYSPIRQKSVLLTFHETASFANIPPSAHTLSTLPPPSAPCSDTSNSPSVDAAHHSFARKPSGNGNRMSMNPTHVFLRFNVLSPRFQAITNPPVGIRMIAFQKTHEVHLGNVSHLATYCCNAPLH